MFCDEEFCFCLPMRGMESFDSSWFRSSREDLEMVGLSVPCVARYLVSITVGKSSCMVR